MQDGTIDKLVVDVELTADDFKEQVISVEKQYDGLKRNLDKTSKNVEKKSKKTKKDLSLITKETKDAGKAFKKSGKESSSFFSPMTKGLLGFAAAVYTLKSAVDAVSKVAEKFADVRVEARESGLSEQEVRARGNAEEKVNINKGTFVDAVKRIRSIQAEARLGNIPAREQLIVAGAKIGLGGGELIDGDPQKIVQRIIDAFQKNPSRFNKDFADKFGLGSYASLSKREYGVYNESLARNRSVENDREKNGTYEEGVKAREAYVETTQRFERAWEDFATKGMPALIALLEGLTTVIEKASSPAWSFEALREYAAGRKPEKSRQTGMLLKLSNSIDKSIFGGNTDKSLTMPNEASLQHSAAQTSVNNTNNVTINQNNKITSNDPVKTARDFAIKGTNTARLNANIVSSQ